MTYAYDDILEESRKIRDAGIEHVIGLEILTSSERAAIIRLLNTMQTAMERYDAERMQQASRQIALIEEYFEYNFYKTPHTTV